MYRYRTTLPLLIRLLLPLLLPQLLLLLPLAIPLLLYFCRRHRCTYTSSQSRCRARVAFAQVFYYTLYINVCECACASGRALSLLLRRMAIRKVIMFTRGGREVLRDQVSLLVITFFPFTSFCVVLFSLLAFRATYKSWLYTIPFSNLVVPLQILYSRKDRFCYTNTEDYQK